ncbi:MAG TPA: tRNA pseudouridine(55) synthase TruB [Candidatus Portnoybacteria bacterium]|nr:tRNA pseudouridine(55) synthase TruB [Candidatus Portnoybacteria bacterium]
MFLLINKPIGITSHDVVDQLRKITGIKKIGHAGTLDPLASGLLIVGIGRESTKQLNKFLKLPKVYQSKIFLGQERDTDDAEGKIISEKKNCPPPSIEVIKKTLTNFIGQQQQIPPQFSAIKLKGKKAYQLARQGKNPKLSPRQVTISEIKLLSYQFPYLEIEVKCSSGTYIRALARDIGRVLNCGAYSADLRRTAIGDFKLKQAKDIDCLSFP